jgi:hypothetical protein
MKTEPRITSSRLLLIISMALYVISLTQECYCTTVSCGDGWSGASIVALGAIGGIMSLTGLTWYANPLLWIAWSLLNKNSKKALMFSASATLVAASFLLADTITDTQAGKASYITAYRPGYWFWLASMLTMTVGSLLIYLWRQKQNALLAKTEVLKVDFNHRCKEGIRLKSKGNLYKTGKSRVRLYEGMPLIIWDDDYDDKQVDNLAVEAIATYNYGGNYWAAAFNHDELKHESQRETPLLNE